MPSPTRYDSTMSNAHTCARSLGQSPAFDDGVLQNQSSAPPRRSPCSSPTSATCRLPSATRQDSCSSTPMPASSTSKGIKSPPTLPRCYEGMLGETRTTPRWLNSSATSRSPTRRSRLATTPIRRSWSTTPNREAAPSTPSSYSRRKSPNTRNATRRDKLTWHPGTSPSHWTADTIEWPSAIAPDRFRIATTQADSDDALWPQCRPTVGPDESLNAVRDAGVTTKCGWRSGPSPTHRLPIETN